VTRRPSPPRRVDLPDARDGLTRLERIVLWQLDEAERELGGPVPTALLYGRVVEHIAVSVDELQAVLQRLVGARR
jgi:hypothetical protein